jgi:2-phosphosulfolactate phosphatase
VSFEQRGHAYRFDWGLEGLRTLAHEATVVVIVDVLRFTTAVDVATRRGAEVVPARWLPQSVPAQVLSPTWLSDVAPGTRLTIASPNGATLSLEAAELDSPVVLAGCLCNASTTAAAARQLAGRRGAIAVIAAGERWDSTDGSVQPLRPNVEDLLGAGAVLAALDPAASLSSPGCSPEAAAARAAFVAARPRLHEALLQSGSGRELAARGFENDIAIAAALDASITVPVLRDGAFVALSG